MGSSFHIENFGCRAARADGEAVASRLRAEGMAESLPGVADVVVVNTCSVTAEADRAARAFIRRAHRLNPEARIVALCDVYDAIRGARPYKPPVSHDEAMHMILRSDPAGRTYPAMFDPALLAILEADATFLRVTFDTAAV